MRVVRYENPKEFKELTWDFLNKYEVEYSMIIGIVSTLVNVPETFPKYRLFAIMNGADLVGVALQTPPHPLTFTKLEEEGVDLLIDELRSNKIEVLGVSAIKESSDYFCKKWMDLNSYKISNDMKMRLFKLTSVNEPKNIKGILRECDENDRELLQDWVERFTIDCHLDKQFKNLKAHVKRSVDLGLKANVFYMWEDEGKPVSMVKKTRETPKGAGLGAVYTPNELRGNGYASASVTRVTQKLLSMGKSYCFLYTDLSNPTSNSIYQKIGYVPVLDFAHYEFEKGILG